MTYKRRVNIDHFAVSHVIGYLLSLSITVIIIASVSLTTYTLISQQKTEAADIMAENIANRVTNDIVNLCTTKEQYPDSDISINLNLPKRLIDEYYYYVQLTNKKVIVGSNTVDAHAESLIYDYSEKLQIDFEGTVDSSNDIILSCEPFDYVHKFDFGQTPYGGVSPGYSRITTESDNDMSTWDTDNYNDYNHRTMIRVENPPDSKDLFNYPVLIQLNEKNFNYDLANSMGYDIGFSYYDGSNYVKLDFWIEQWNSADTHTSRIWVELDTLIAESSKTIYMYYGNSNIDDTNTESDGSQTFSFFDEFDKSSVDTGLWTEDKKNNQDIFINIKDQLILKNGASLISTSDFGNTPCIIEAKVKSISDINDHKEVGIFTRYQSAISPPYEDSYLFLSGLDEFLSPYTLSSSYGLSLLKYSGGVFSEVISSGVKSDSMEKDDWYKMTYLLFDSDHIVCRYFNSNYSIDSYLSLADSTYLGDGKFGLCTISDSGVKAVFDWVFVRQFIPYDSSIDERYEVSSNIGYTQSQVFYLDLNNIVDEESYGSNVDDHFICSSASNAEKTFTITGLIEPEYTLTFTAGDKQKTTSPVEGMTITIKGSVTDVIDVDCTSTNPVKKYHISNVQPNAGDSIEVTFDDSDGPGPNYYWAICSMKIQKGDRKVEIN